MSKTVYNRPWNFDYKSFFRNLMEFPLLSKTTAYRGIISPGECLFLPALWFHATRALSFAVSINSFFKSLDDKLYGKDLYGNRDPLPVEEAARAIQRAKNSLEILPERYKLFYLNKLGLKWEIQGYIFVLDMVVQKGKEATKGQKQIDRENAASFQFYTYITIGAVSLSWVSAIYFQTSYLLPLFG